MRAQGLFVCGCLLLVGTLAALAYCSFLHNNTNKIPAATQAGVPTRVGESVPLPGAVATNPQTAVGASAVRPAPAPAVPVPAPEPRVLRIAKSFPDGGGFNWDGGTGTPEEIRFSGQKILSKAKRGTYCCGFTFAVVMRAASDAGLLTGKSVAQIRKFQQHWYAATPEAREKQQIYALEWLGIGRQVPLMDARPGDFVRLWHGSSGHSVIFVRWIEQDGLKVGLEYRGTQGSTNGIGNRIEYLPRTPGHAEGDFELERTYVGRLNDAGRVGAM